MMRDSIWNKRIPTVLGLVVLSLSVVTISWLGENKILFGGKAAGGNIPKNVEITNSTDTAFTVSFTTPERSIASIAYGETSSYGNVMIDDNDKTIGTPLSHHVHSITLTKLKPQTKYYFAIISDGTTFTNTTGPYEMTTGKTLTVASPNSPSIVGKVLLPGGDIPSEGIVYASTSASQILSLILRQDGSFILPLNLLRTNDLSSYVKLTPKTIVNFTITNGINTSNVKVLSGGANPIPPITLSNDYDFSISTEALVVPSQSAEISPIFSAFPATYEKTSSTPQIITPKAEQQFKDQQPMFQGTAIPNATVQIVIHSTDPISTTVTADKNGNWTFRPTTPLSPGNHIITIITRDALGALKTISQNFTVYAQGSQFTQPSVSPVAPTTTPLPTATLTPTPTRTQPINTTPTPVASISPTLSMNPTISVTAIPTPTSTVAPTPTPILLAVSVSPTITQAPLPNPGSSSIVIGLVFTGLSIGTGLMLFFLTQGKTTL